MASLRPKIFIRLGVINNVIKLFKFLSLVSEVGLQGWTLLEDLKGRLLTLPENIRLGVRDIKYIKHKLIGVRN
jgi:hypothetical protein